MQIKVLNDFVGFIIVIFELAFVNLKLILRNGLAPNILQHSKIERSQSNLNWDCYVQIIYSYYRVINHIIIYMELILKIILQNEIPFT